MEGNYFEKLMKVSAGFPSPANDYLEPDLDYNAYFKKHPSSTFSFRVDGESMIDSFIPHNSIVVVDRSIKPYNNCIVVATLNGERLIKHIVNTKDGIFLLPANDKFKSIKVEEAMEFSIWGTVTHVIIDIIKR
ncbi:MAG: LexA family protein [Chitinophagaceae bacterium]